MKSMKQNRQPLLGYTAYHANPLGILNKMILHAFNDKNVFANIE